MPGVTLLTLWTSWGSPRSKCRWIFCKNIVQGFLHHVILCYSSWLLLWDMSSLEYSCFHKGTFCCQKCIMGLSLNVAKWESDSNLLLNGGYSYAQRNSLAQKVRMSKLHHSERCFWYLLSPKIRLPRDLELYSVRIEASCWSQTAQQWYHKGRIQCWG